MSWFCRKRGRLWRRLCGGRLRAWCCRAWRRRTVVCCSKMGAPHARNCNVLGRRLGNLCASRDFHLYGFPSGLEPEYYLIHRCSFAPREPFPADFAPVVKRACHRSAVRTLLATSRLIVFTIYKPCVPSIVTCFNRLPHVHQHIRSA